MGAQVPAEGISLIMNHKDFKLYRLACKCGCDHSVELMFETDEGIKSLQVLSTTSTGAYREPIPVRWSEDPWIVYAVKDYLNDMINRMRIAWRALVHGEVKTESAIILSEQQLKNIIATIQSELNG